MRKLPTTCLATAVLLTAVLLQAAPASAQDARELFSQGQAAYETGDYDTAVRNWRQAWEIDPRPLLQYNLAQAYERLGQLDLAVTSYRAYVEASPGDDARAQNARARIASLEQRVGNTSIRLTGGVEGASIIVDGQDRGRLPHPDPLRLDPGSHRIVIRADGYEDFVSVAAVSAGQQADVVIDMRPGVTGQAATTTSGGGISMIGLGIAIGGAAVAIGGTVTGGLALSAAGDAPSSTGPQADDARTLALVTDILLPVGGVIAVTGLILMFVLEDGGGSGSAQVVPLLGPGLAGAAVLGQF